MFNMNMIDVMPPGLYEVMLTEADASAANPELIPGNTSQGSNRARSMIFARSAAMTPPTNAVSRLRLASRKSIGTSIAIFGSRSSISDDAGLGGILARDASQSRDVSRFLRPKPVPRAGPFGGGKDSGRPSSRGGGQSVFDAGER